MVFPPLKPTPLVLVVEKSAIVQGSESKSLEIGSKRSLGEQETASNQKRLRAPSGRIRSMPAGSKNRAHEMALKTCSSAHEGANETNSQHELLCYL